MSPSVDTEIQPEVKSEPTEESGTVVTNGTAKVEDDLAFSGKVVQITNVSPGTNLQQIATLFGFLGTVTDIRMYPSEEQQNIAVKLCYIKYENSEQCGVAQHLTNTVFIDKPLIVVPLNREDIPEENECVQLLKSVNTYAGMHTAFFVSPNGIPLDESQQLPALPTPPIITSTTDPVEIEEIRRTIFVKDINPTITSEQLMAFFSGVGEVKYLRYAKGTEQARHAFIEFSVGESVSTAMQYNGVIFGGRCIQVDYAKSAISKPESEKIAAGRTPVRRMRDVDVRNPSLEMRRSLSRSPSRRRSRSRDNRRRSRSRDIRRRSRSRSRRNRSRSGSRRRSRRSPTRSPIRRRSRSRSKSRSPRRRSRRSRSRSKSKDRKRKSKSRSPKRKSKKKSRSKSRSPSRRKSRKSSSKSPDRSSSKKKKRGEKEKEKEKPAVKETEEETEKELKSLLDKIYTYEQDKTKDKKSSSSTTSKPKKE